MPYDRSRQPVGDYGIYAKDANIDFEGMVKRSGDIAAGMRVDNQAK